MKKIGMERRRRSRITLSWESKLLQLSNEFLAYSTLNFWKIWLISCSFASIFLVMREETEDQREERKDVHDQFTLQQQPGSLKRGRTKTSCNKVASMCNEALRDEEGDQNGVPNTRAEHGPGHPPKARAQFGGRPCPWQAILSLAKFRQKAKILKKSNRKLSDFGGFNRHN